MSNVGPMRSFGFYDSTEPYCVKLTVRYQNRLPTGYQFALT